MKSTLLTLVAISIVLLPYTARAEFNFEACKQTPASQRTQQCKDTLDAYYSAEATYDSAIGGMMKKPDLEPGTDNTQTQINQLETEMEYEDQMDLFDALFDLF